MHVNDCDYETLLALADQMPRERFDQIKEERPDFSAWLDVRHVTIPGVVARGLRDTQLQPSSQLIGTDDVVRRLAGNSLLRFH